MNSVMDSASSDIPHSPTIPMTASRPRTQTWWMSLSSTYLADLVGGAQACLDSTRLRLEEVEKHGALAYPAPSDEAARLLVRLGRSPPRG